MAFSAGMIWQGWSSGDVSNGGGFNPTNANFFTDLTVDTNTGNTAAPVASSASYNFVADDVGHWLFIQSGTDWIPGWYLVASVGSNKATLTAGIGAAVLYGTSATGRAYQRPQGLNTTAGCSTVGTPTGGVWAIDYSQNTASRSNPLDLVIDGATNTDATSAGVPFGKQHLGNIWNVTSGTGFTVQRVELVSIPSGVIGRFDKSLGTLGSTGGNAIMGGAAGSTSLVTVLTYALTAGNKIFLKGTFTLTVTTTVTASAKGDITSGRISVEGFTTYPGERDGRPVITSATNSVHLITINDNDFWEFAHLKFTHTAATRGGAFTSVTSASTPLWLKDLIVDGCLTLFNSTAQTGVLRLEGLEILNTTSTTAAINTTINSTWLLYGCDIHDNAGDGFRFTGTSFISLEDCILDTNVGAGLNGVSATASATILLQRSVFVDNGGSGFKLASTSGINALAIGNNIFYNNGAYGIENLDTQAETDTSVHFNRNNAYGANVSNPLLALAAGYGDITLTADPFVNKAARNFNLNNAAGGGLAIKAKAFPVTFPSGTTNSYRDVGAVQHQDGPIGQVVKVASIGTY